MTRKMKILLSALALLCFLAISAAQVSSYEPYGPMMNGWFAGYGGQGRLPIWGGAGAGERYSNGIDNRGRGLYPF